MADAKAKLEAKKKPKAKKSTKKDDKPEDSKATKSAKPKQKFDATKVTAEELAKMKKDYAELRLNVNLGKEQNQSKVKELRRNIARALTHLNSKQETKE